MQLSFYILFNKGGDKMKTVKLPTTALPIKDAYEH